MGLNVLQVILNFTERAAKLARIIRQDPCLFALLIEEKGEAEKNARFVQDFKTLADVLIQETLKNCVNSKFPNLTEHIRGEESSSFTNTLGENINVKICETQNETACLLSKVLDGNFKASNILAEVVHEQMEDVKISEDLIKKIPSFESERLGIWIDPIDSTAEYISGRPGERDSASGIFQNGLPCVTILVGIYDKNSGLPIGGVINQPFAESVNSSWKSRIYWGICGATSSAHSSLGESSATNESKPILVISSSEKKEFQNELKKNFNLLHVTGAGYKSLVVTLDLAQAYFCSMGSTYRWDTCAPHGILRSIGGGIISFKSLISLGRNEHLSCEQKLKDHQLKYELGNSEVSSDAKRWCNIDGLVVYRNPLILPKIYESFACTI